MEKLVGRLAAHHTAAARKAAAEAAAGEGTSSEAVAGADGDLLMRGDRVRRLHVVPPLPCKPHGLLDAVAFHDLFLTVFSLPSPFF
jgi:hypothetical protein